MQDPNPPHPSDTPMPPYPSEPPKSGGVPWWGWLLIVVGALTACCCAGIIGFVIYAGGGPDTAVYPESSLPTEYRQVAEGHGLVDPGERILYFYSDAVRDVSGSYVLVTDDHVAVRNDAAGTSRLIPFTEILSTQLHRDTSFFVDSVIVLQMVDGSTVEFFVSSEFDRDERFHEAIRAEGLGGAAPATQP